MKTTMFICSLLVASLMVGCQENSIMDPVATTASERTLLGKDQPVSTLALSAILHEPGSVHNSFLEVSGAATYAATVVPLDPIPPNPQYAARLNLTVNAAVTPYEPSVPPMPPVWLVSGTSVDWVPIPQSGEAFVVKHCRIDGRTDGMLLVLKFRITLTSVELNRMWLELPRIQPAADLE